jgi:Carboxypeptidase regulatory-like domain/Putative zinc-finger
VNQKLHPGPHPDADQLSIFVEGVANAREREQMLAHLSECEECRDVVFLMQRPVEISSAAKGLSKERVWQSWFVPAALTGAVLAGLAALLLYVRPSTRTPEAVRETAVVEQPKIEAHGTFVAPSTNPPAAVKPEKDKNGSEPGRMAMNTVRQLPRATARSSHQSAGSHPASARATTRGTAAGVPSVSVSATAEASAAPEYSTQPVVNPVPIQELPLTGRNVAKLQPPEAPWVAPEATARDNSEAQGNLPALRVEGLSHQDKTLSGVSGRVTDASGAVIPGATVALRGAAGDTRQMATAADGSFRLTGIPAGHYDLTVTSPGFRSNQQSIDLKPNELATVQPVLTVGEVTQTVEVTSSAQPVETESASVSSMPAKLPSRLPVVSSASLGERTLSLDRAGSLFLSRNAGKSWKKVHPQWRGKAVRIDLTAAKSAKANDKIEASGAESAMSVFQLTTDSGSQWTSKDGKHWRPQ